MNKKPANYNFSENLENQLRLEVRQILETLPVNTRFDDGHWIVTIDVTEAENRLTKLALDCY